MPRLTRPAEMTSSVALSSALIDVSTATDGALVELLRITSPFVVLNLAAMRRGSDSRDEFRLIR
jgi:hypothetical protein